MPPPESDSCLLIKYIIPELIELSLERNSVWSRRAGFSQQAEKSHTRIQDGVVSVGNVITNCQSTLLTVED